VAYNVVFEGTGEDGSNYPGIRTISSFPTGADFDKIRETLRDKVIAEGVSDSRAHYLASQTSIEARVNAVLLQAKEQPQHRERLIANAIMAAQHDGIGGHEFMLALILTELELAK
jgi:hypothetical protein